ncbi:hypothetical protein ECoL_01655 [Escherichia coli EC4100B]|nr:hypothetical protein ECoL_01655 [Escherichia coli EC4100B]
MKQCGGELGEIRHINPVFQPIRAIVCIVAFFRPQPKFVAEDWAKLPRL